MLFVESRLLGGHNGFAVLQPRLAVVVPRPLLRLSRQGRFPNLNLRNQDFAPAVCDAMPALPRLPQRPSAADGQETLVAATGATSGSPLVPTPLCSLHFTIAYG